jgi:hypothetical protein
MNEEGASAGAHRQRNGTSRVFADREAPEENSVFLFRTFGPIRRVAERD